MLKWIADSVAEEAIAKSQFSLEGEKRNVQVKEIDLNMSWYNHARVSPKNPELCTKYAEAMKAGAAFPRPLLFELPMGFQFSDGRKLAPGCKYVIAGGNHRIGAAILNGAKEVEAWVIDTDDLFVTDVLPRALNQHGTPVSEDEEMASIVYTHNTYGTPVKTLAAIFGRSVNAITKELRIRDITEQLQKLKVTGVEKLNKSTRYYLGSLEGDEDVFKNAASLVVASGMSSEDVKVFTAKMGTVKNHAAKLAHIASLCKQYGLNKKSTASSSSSKERKVSAPANPQFKEFRRVWVSLMYRLTNFPTASKNGVTTHEQRSELRKEITSVKRMLRTLDESCVTSDFTSANKGKMGNSSVNSSGNSASNSSGSSRSPLRKKVGGYAKV